MTLTFCTGQASWRSASMAAVVSFGAVLTLVHALHDQLDLAARSEPRTDSDGDGLTDLEEFVLGTSSDSEDSDGDGFEDLEEQARGTDPLDAVSLPQLPELDVGLYASAENGIVKLVSAVYVPDGNLQNLDFQMGLVLRGRPVLISPAIYSRAIRLLIFPGRAMGSRIVVAEIPIGESLIQRRGQLNIFAGIRNPIEDTAAVDVSSLVDFSGVTMSVEPSTTPFFNGNAVANGVTYRPLGGDDQIPATWSSGQVCWQRMTPVGQNGASVVHEVDAANCQSTDSYCSPSDCSGSVGGLVELPDPGGLIGG
jgi:hypothetical protein